MVYIQCAPHFPIDLGDKCLLSVRCKCFEPCFILCVCCKFLYTHFPFYIVKILIFYFNAYARDYHVLDTQDKLAAWVSTLPIAYS